MARRRDALVGPVPVGASDTIRSCEELVEPARLGDRRLWVQDWVTPGNDTKAGAQRRPKRLAARASGTSCVSNSHGTNTGAPAATRTANQSLFSVRDRSWTAPT